MSKQWNSMPARADKLSEATRCGMFRWSSKAGAYLSEEELMWTQMYGEDGPYEFWSVGYPKKEIVQLTRDLEFPSEGLAAAVLGCGVGVEVDYLARRASASGSSCIAGIDFALPAIEKARRDFGHTEGAVFYHGDVCDLPAPSSTLDLVIDNTVFQNVHGTESEAGYLDALRRIATAGHTVLHLNLMSREGMEGRSEFRPCLEDLDLPLLSKAEILEAFDSDWEVLDIREGLYDLKPEAAGVECPAFYEFGGERTPGIPSWWLMLRRK